MANSRARATLRKARQEKRLQILKAKGVDVSKWNGSSDQRVFIKHGVVPKGYKLKGWNA